MFKTNLKHVSLLLALTLGFSSHVFAQSEPQDLKDPTRSGSTNPTGGYVSPDNYYWSANTANETTGKIPIPTANINNLNDIQAENLDKTVNKDAVPTDKAKQIDDTAYAFGLQAGLAKGTQEYNDALNKNAPYYDQAYNFSALEIEPGILPPVISEGRNAYRGDSDSTVRFATRIYHIEFKARLVATPPRWQDYLIGDVVPPSALTKENLPKTKGEKAVWDDAVSRGWNDGIAQSKQNFEDNLGRLNRDFNGMVRYKELYAQGYVRKPEIARTPLGTTGGGDEMALNDIVVEITQNAALDPNQKDWIKPSASAPVTASNDH
jgi:defect in organelle trafficking protein DotC